MKWFYGLLFALVFTACTQGNVQTLEVGDCFDDTTDLSGEISDVPVVECSQPHDNEVYSTYDMTESTYPGFDVAADLADVGCVDRFAGYVGQSYELSDLDFAWLIPTDESWNNGDREVVCFLYRVDLGKITGSMKDSGI